MKHLFGLTECVQLNLLILLRRFKSVGKYILVILRFQYLKFKTSKVHNDINNVLNVYISLSLNGDGLFLDLHELLLLCL